MRVYDFCRGILEGGRIEDKLQHFTQEPGEEIFDKFRIASYVKPNRDSKIRFCNEQIKFPKKGRLKSDEGRGLALHFFANHELLAIEMMAAAILLGPNETETDRKIKKSILATLQDEQKHLKIYIQRMNQLGVEFGEFPLNDYFWRQMTKVKSMEEYFSLMALTFEAANLDFSLYYEQLFRDLDDEQTANIMKVVYEDEIKHVGVGTYWLNQNRGDQELWSYYCSCLPELVTPARSKGMTFDIEGRKRAGLSDDFIGEQKNYQDNFKITQRKNWNEQTTSI